MRVAIAKAGWFLALAAPMVTAQDDDPRLRAAFDAAYGQYLTAIEEPDLDRAAEAASESLRLGRRVFGESNQNTANLLQNHAAALELLGFSRQAREQYLAALQIIDALHGEDAPQKIPVLMSVGGLYLGGFGEADAEYLLEALSIQKRVAPDDLRAYAKLAVEAGTLLTRAESTRDTAIEILAPVLDDVERKFGDESIELIRVLMVLGKAEADQFDRAAQERRYRRAIGIAEEALSGSPLELAALKLEAGRDLLYLSRSDSGEHYLRSALRAYESELGPGHELTATAAMSLGELRFMQGRFASAESLLLDALAVFAGQSQFQVSEQRIRTLLVDGYERAGDSDKATEHLVALGRLVQFADTQALVPIFTVAAEYPERDAAARREGRVVVGFTVDATGRTRDHFIMSTEVNESMQQAAIEAARRYRFAPRIVDGTPVEVPNQRLTIEFSLAD